MSNQTMSNHSMSWDLSGAVTLITGAGGSIGRATCALLSAAGARVVATDLSSAPQDVKVDLWSRQDVTSPTGWRELVDDISHRFGRLDCLINSAGICPLERIEKTSLELWRKVMSVNVESMLLGMQATLPLLRESGKARVGGASIVNLASTAGLRGVQNASAYCASKGAVTLLTKSAAKEFAGLKYPIRVNSVHPASVDSEMMDQNFARWVELGSAPSLQAMKEKVFAAHPLGRMAKPEEVAHGIAFLCSPAASYMTGSELVIDGAVTA